MKKITLLFVALLACGVGFAQTETYVSETGGENNPITYVEQNYEYAPCTFSAPGNSFENGKSCTQNLGRKVAHDIVVAMGENNILSDITAYMFIGAAGSGVNAAFVDVYYYSDGGGIPGAMVGSELGVIPTTQTVVGSNFGFDVWAVDLDVVDFPLLGNAGTPITYWIGLSLEATDGSNVFWENSTAGVIGNPEAYDDGLGGGYVSQAGLEGVYDFNGDCVPILGVDDNLADLVNIYPNPATTLINIDVPANVTITDVALYDVLGKNTGATLINGAIDVSNLSRGVYILNINSEQGTLTQKVIKR